VFEAVADGEQLRLVHDVFAALLEVIFVDVRFHDRIHWTALLAKTAIDTLEQVDVVARGAARAVGALLRIDRDRKRRAYGFAQLAGDAAFLAVRLTMYLPVNANPFSSSSSSRLLR
jgi:hypothetical protein